MGSLLCISRLGLATTAFADPIHDAAWDGDLAGVQAELDKGVDVNAKEVGGGIPLQIATAQGHKEIVELLIAKGADVNTEDNFDTTPLDVAIKFKRPKIADLLRKHGGKTGAELKAAGK